MLLCNQAQNADSEGTVVSSHETQDAASKSLARAQAKKRGPFHVMVQVRGRLQSSRRWSGS